MLAIANFLDIETARIDSLIAKKHHLIERLDERKSATFAAGAGGLLTHHGSFETSSLEWLDRRPSHWREPLLRLVARTGSGHTPSRGRPDWWEDCWIPWITTGEVAQVRSDEREEITETRECISELGLANSAAVLHPKGTVVLCRTASAGYSAIMGTDMATSQDFATWTCGPDLRPRFLLLCLRAMRQDLLGRLATGSTHKTIYMPDIHALRIPLPPVAEQDEIVDAAWSRLTPTFIAMRRIREQIALLKEHRQALIAAAITGQIEVPGVAA
jgi:type I restriction enzyme S subunit